MEIFEKRQAVTLSQSASSLNKNTPYFLRINKTDISDWNFLE